jgi:hypothetical protein
MFKCQGSWTPWFLKLGPIGCSETSVTSYQSALLNFPDERSSLCGGQRLESCMRLSFLWGVYWLKYDVCIKPNLVLCFCLVTTVVSLLYLVTMLFRRLRWSSGLVPEFAVSNPAEAVGFFLFKKSSACLLPEGKLNYLSHVPTLRHVKEPSNCGKLRIVSKIPSIKSSLLR